MIDSGVVSRENRICLVRAVSVGNLSPWKQHDTRQACPIGQQNDHSLYQIAQRLLLDAVITRTLSRVSPYTASRCFPTVFLSASGSETRQKAKGGQS